jgi:glycosyltransferase involved in cell wall biosynthesis
MDPRVTIILTVYQRTDLLRFALESALAQTYQNFEIIIADDSGSESAKEVCQPYVDGKRVHYRPNPTTLGIALSLRAAIGQARGTYLAVLNDDDVWGPEFLSTLVPALEADPRCVLGFSDHWIMDDNGELDVTETDINTARYGRATLPEGIVLDAATLVLIHNGVPLAMAALFRKDALDLSLLTPDVAGAYDLWISCVLASLGRPFFYTPKRLTRYRVHSRMETGRRSHDRSANLVYIFSQTLERRWFPQLESYLRSRLGAALFHLGRDKLYFNRLREARSCFSGSLANHRDWRPAIASGLSFLPRFMRQRLKVSGAED